jgi:hypothetical protein
MGNVPVRLDSKSAVPIAAIHRRQSQARIIPNVVTTPAAMGIAMEKSCVVHGRELFAPKRRNVAMKAYHFAAVKPVVVTAIVAKMPRETITAVAARRRNAVLAIPASRQMAVVTWAIAAPATVGVASIISVCRIQQNVPVVASNA